MKPQIKIDISKNRILTTLLIFTCLGLSGCGNWEYGTFSSYSIGGREHRQEW